MHWTKEDGDWYDGTRMDAWLVQGLRSETQLPRSGRFAVKNSSGEEHIFNVRTKYGLKIPEPDGLYTLLGAVGTGDESPWVVGKIEEPEGKFRKVFAVWMDREDRKRHQSLNIYEVTKTFLL
ncbi:hypothetical protein ARMGADRAFT_1036717 [Armillaria gallica]|uniref:Uncharacterized protein n=1 Tax=Armillaria gallica TaxID=47427 RepID=A0A2H3DC08_ARMGA|nr:hypothetical protein ARMGADRAFT_1036717 [Armillaria gallica]